VELWFKFKGWRCDLQWIVKRDIAVQKWYFSVFYFKDHVIVQIICHPFVCLTQNVEELFPPGVFDCGRYGRGGMALGWELLSGKMAVLSRMLQALRTDTRDRCWLTTSSHKLSSLQQLRDSYYQMYSQGPWRFTLSHSWFTWWFKTFHSLCYKVLHEILIGVMHIAGCDVSNTLSLQNSGCLQLHANPGPCVPAMPRTAIPFSQAGWLHQHHKEGEASQGRDNEA
jgi:hypothetical protein